MSRGDSRSEIEEFPKRIKIFLAVIILLFLFGTIGFMIITKSDFNSSFSRTAQTLAFIFEDDTSNSERVMEILLAIIGVFLVWWVLWSISDLILDGNLKKYLKRRFYTFKINNMQNHSIIIGGGRIGEEISKVLSSKKKEFTIIESNPEVVKVLKKKGYITIEGDAKYEETLKLANIKKASKFIITLPETETNIVLTLTAKELNPKIEVHSRCENISLVSKLKKAGAKVVTIPEIVAADKIAKDLKI